MQNHNSFPYFEREPEPPRQMMEEADLAYIHKVQRAFNYMDVDEAVVVVMSDNRNRSPEHIAKLGRMPKEEVERLLIKGRLHLKNILESLE